MLVDTHTHLETFEQRGQLKEVFARAAAAGVSRMITIGTASDDWGGYRALAARHAAQVAYTAGLHPCSVGERWPDELAQLEDYWSGRAGPMPVALGECGLDRFHLPKDDEARADQVFGWQQAAFAAQLVLAARLRCPLVVHSRGAFAECVAMIDASGVPWSGVVFHCFTEGPAEVAELVTRGGFASFTGIITYKTAEPVRAALRAQGLDRLMLETDAPYLAPVPQRGQENEPAYLRHTAEHAAQLLGVDLAALAAQTSSLAMRFFGL
jgi:TatD DNase family protein